MSVIISQDTALRFQYHCNIKVILESESSVLRSDDDILNNPQLLLILMRSCARSNIRVTLRSESSVLRSESPVSWPRLRWDQSCAGRRGVKT